VEQLISLELGSWCWLSSTQPLHSSARSCAKSSCGLHGRGSSLYKSNRSMYIRDL
jgi:hypothetical protein